MSSENGDPASGGVGGGGGGGDLSLSIGETSKQSKISFLCQILTFINILFSN